MKTFTGKHTHTGPCSNCTQSYVHHPLNPAIQAKQTIMRKALHPNDAQEGAGAGISIQMKQDGPPEAQLQRQPEEEEPVQTRLLQRQADEEVEEEVE